MALGELPPELPRDEAASFQLLKYELDRTHELELNKFSYGLEIERLKILQLLNGGAFTALIAFFDKEMLRAGDDMPPIFLSVAVVAWLGGLGIAALATQRALDAQSKFAAAYHTRRRATEWRVLRINYPALADLEKLVGPPPVPDARLADDYSLSFPGPVTADDGDARFAWKTGVDVKSGRVSAKLVNNLYGIGLLLFLVGGIAAALLVGRSGPAA